MRARYIHITRGGGRKKKGGKRREKGRNEGKKNWWKKKKKKREREEEGGGLHRYLPNAGLSHAVTLGEKGSIIRVYPIGLSR